MTTIGEIYHYIDGFAPFHTQMGFDNAGLLAGSPKDAVNTVLLALDITPAVVREAAARGAELVISHHPVIFNPLKRLEPETAPYLLAKHGVAAICAHTNLDMAAQGGVNACLAQKLGLKDIRTLHQDEAYGLPDALMGDLETPLAPRAFAQYVRDALGCDGVRYTDGGREITRVGLCSGGGEDWFYYAAQADCQAFVTGESKHHILLDAENAHVTLVDAGHYYTECVVLEPLKTRLSEQFPAIRFVLSQKMHSPAKFI